MDSPREENNRPTAFMNIAAKTLKKLQESKIRQFLRGKTIMTKLGLSPAFKNDNPIDNIIL